MKKENDKEGIKITIKKFEKSEKNLNDYVELFLVYHKSIRPDDSVTWSEVEELIKDNLR